MKTGLKSRPSTSVGTCTSLNPSSLLLSTEASVIDYLGSDSGSDHEMSIEAKRITRKKKLEREKLQKLGNYHKINADEMKMIHPVTSFL